MSLPELMVSLTIGILLLGVVFSIWYFLYQTWAVERIRTELRLNLEVAMEKLKEELRLSSVTYISLYKPVGSADYTAISFPAANPDFNGFSQLDADGYVYWDNSVIYHVYETPPASGKLELRRTIFTDNH